MNYFLSRTGVYFIHILIIEVHSIQVTSIHTIQIGSCDAIQSKIKRLGCMRVLSNLLIVFENDSLERTLC